MEINTNHPKLKPPDLFKDGLLTEAEARSLHSMFLNSPAGYDALLSVVNRYLSFISDIRILRLDEADRASNPGFATSIRYWVVSHVEEFFSSLTDIKERMDDQVKRAKAKVDKKLPDVESEFQ